MFGLVYSGIALFNQSILEQRGFDASVFHTALVVSTMIGLGARTKAMVVLISRSPKSSAIESRSPSRMPACSKPNAPHVTLIWVCKAASPKWRCEFCNAVRIVADPAKPDQTYELVLKEQTVVRVIDVHPENYPESLTSQPFDRYFINTMIDNLTIHVTIFIVMTNIMSEMTHCK
jgi:hypothetical protein